jgi:Flp pilus assembly protein TadD
MNMMPTKRNRLTAILAPLLACVLLAGCATKMESGYGVGIQAEREAALGQATQKDNPPDTPGMYLALIDRMQSQGLFFASLAHIDAYEKQYGVSPDTILLRADALRQTGQPDASATAYTQLLPTPLAARGYHGLGLLAGHAGDFARAAQAFETASRLQPTDAATLSDLGYARLRLGDVAGARVPLMKAAELAQGNPKIMSNVALFLLASGQAGEAHALIAQQKFSPEVQQAIRRDAQQIGLAGAALPVPAVSTAAASAQTVDTLIKAQLQLTQPQFVAR